MGEFVNGENYACVEGEMYILFSQFSVNLKLLKKISFFFN